MELDDFRAAVADAAALLKGLQVVVPKRVDQALIDYLDRLQADPVGLEVLRNVMPTK
jgi:hypothetical protein